MNRVTISAPRDTHLAAIEKAASFQNGGQWKVVDDAHGCWKCPVTKGNLVWVLQEVRP